MLTVEQLEGLEVLGAGAIGQRLPLGLQLRELGEGAGGIWEVVGGVTGGSGGMWG